MRKAAKNEIIILKMSVLGLEGILCYWANWERLPMLLSLCRVKHPNILQLVDVYITRKEYFIFLEL